MEAEMSEMVDRVARVIARAVGAEQGISSDAWIDESWAGWVPDARAAIEAMRESTEEMASAVNREFGFSDGHKSAAMLASPRVWRTMIDAALT